MISLAVIHKTARDAAGLFVLTLVAVVLFEILFVLAMSNLAPDLLDLWSRLGFLKRIFQVLFSINLDAEVSTSTLVVVGYAHPFLFAVTWGFLITACTRATVGEIDRGTADLLLSLPLSRVAVYASPTVVWLAACAVISSGAWIGVGIGSKLFPLPEPLEMRRLAVASVNLFTLYLAIGALTMCISSMVNRRGVAVALAVSVLLISFLINFLSAFVPFFQRIRFLGLLCYYRPVELVRDGRWPLDHLAVLGSIAAICWTAGLLVFCRKNIPVA